MTTTSSQEDETVTGTAHPYMANSAPELREELCAAVGVRDPDDLFAQIPADHITQEPFVLPPALASEVELSRHLRRLLSANVDCEATLSFLGGGCWQHHVPAVCDELATRTEFLTPVWGTASSDHGRNQAWFEFASQLGELLELDFVSSAGLQLGLRRRSRDPHGGTPHGTDRGAGARVARPGAARGNPYVLRAAGHGWPHRPAARRGRSDHGLPRPRRAGGRVLRAHRRRVLRDARVARRDRVRLRAGRGACPR